jgi:hypothetical protein
VSQGYVYIMSDDTHSYLKIGMTTRTPEMRAKELNSTGMPGNLVVIDSIFVENCEAVEEALHHGLSKYRVKKNREFFDLPSDVACAYLRSHSAGTVERKAFEDLCDEIGALKEDGGIDSMNKALNLTRKKLLEIEGLKHEFIKMVTDSGNLLCETFKNEPMIQAKDLGPQFSMNPIVFDPKDPAAWIIQLANFQFTFDGSVVRDNWFKRFQEQGEKTLGLFLKTQRLAGEGKIGISVPVVYGIEYEEIFLKFLEDRKASTCEIPKTVLVNREYTDMMTNMMTKFHFEYFDNTVLDYPFEPAERRNEIFHKFLDPLIKEHNRFTQLSDWQKRKYMSRQIEPNPNPEELFNQRVVDLLDEIREMERKYLMPTWDSIVLSFKSIDEIIKAHLAWKTETELLLKYIRLMLFDASKV